MLLIIGVVIGLVVGGAISGVIVVRRKTRGCIGDLVFATDEDGGYTFIKFNSQEVIDSLRRGDIVSFNVVTQK